MKNKLTKQEKDLYLSVGEVLYYIWDPIGVSEEPYARDEYDSYVPQVFKRLIDGSSNTQIENYLNEISTTNMGVGKNQKHTKKVVEILLEYKEKIYDDNL